MTIKHLQTLNINSTTASVTFSNINQDYDDLMILFSARTDRGTVGDGLAVSFNGTDNTDESRIQFFGTGTAVGSGAVSSIRIGHAAAATATSNTFGSTWTYIYGYSRSQPKPIMVDTIIENNGTEGFPELHTALWDNIAAITSIAISSDNGANIVAGTKISLYGVTRGGSGTTSTT